MVFEASPRSRHCYLLYRAWMYISEKTKLESTNGSFFPQNMWLDSLSGCWWNIWWECSGMLMNGGVRDTTYIGENWDGISYRIKYLPRFKWLSWRLQISWGQNSGTFVQEFLWMLVRCLNFLNESGEQLTWGSPNWVVGTRKFWASRIALREAWKDLTLRFLITDTERDVQLWLQSPMQWFNPSCVLTLESPGDLKISLLSGLQSQRWQFYLV